MIAAGAILKKGSSVNDRSSKSIFATLLICRFLNSKFLFQAQMSCRFFFKKKNIKNSKIKKRYPTEPFDAPILKKKYTFTQLLITLYNATIIDQIPKDYL